MLAAGLALTASCSWPCTRRAWATTPASYRKFGAMPESGSDFVTAPELYAAVWPDAGRAGGRGPGAHRHRTRSGSSAQASGALALQLLRWRWASRCSATPSSICRAACARASRRVLAAHAPQSALGWMRCPRRCEGVVVGNEVLDAMPVQLLARHGGAKGRLARARCGAGRAKAHFAWPDRPTDLRPPAGQWKARTTT